MKLYHFLRVANLTFQSIYTKVDISFQWPQILEYQIYIQISDISDLLYNPSWNSYTPIHLYIQCRRPYPSPQGVHISNWIGILASVFGFILRGRILYCGFSKVVRVRRQDCYVQLLPREKICITGLLLCYEYKQLLDMGKKLNVSILMDVCVKWWWRKYHV